MGEKGVGKGYGRARRIITNVVVTYRLEGEPRAAERTFTIAHEGDGEVVDGIVWSDELMEKVVYREPDGSSTEPKKQAGKGWTTNLMAATTETTETTDAGGPCIWLHDVTCTWSEYCPPV